ncbi:MAG: hypothetical protein ACLQGU_04260 [bacterium]
MFDTVDFKGIWRKKVNDCLTLWRKRTVPTLQMELDEKDRFLADTWHSLGTFCHFVKSEEKLDSRRDWDGGKTGISNLV